MATRNDKIRFFQGDLIEAIGAGIYEISVERNDKSQALYTGESVNVLVWCAEHLYKLNENPSYFGFTNKTINDSSIILKFRLIKDSIDIIKDNEKRKEVD